MTTIIDLGNGYGRIEKYGSPYAQITFPLNRHELSRLYNNGFITKMDFQQALLDMSYAEGEARWFVALASVTVAEWKARLPNARTI